MAFKVRCTNCQKVYAAETRWIGKRIRCKQCGESFIVEQPADDSLTTPIPVALPEMAELPVADPTASRSSASAAGTKIAKIAPPKNTEDPDDIFALRSDDVPAFRASVPQAFPMSDIVEAWLPLALGLIAVVWSATQTFSGNDTGRGWVAPLRFGAAAILYVLLITPLTYYAVTSSFRKMRRSLPPNPLSRVATTFALPACLAFVFWQVSEGIGGLITGLIMGLVLMAAVFWLLFRLDPQEAANAYAKACGFFVAGTIASALIVMGASSVINHAMIEAHAVAFKESPLGAALAWKAPEPIARPQPKPSDDSVATAEGSQPPPRSTASVAQVTRAEAANSSQPATPPDVIPIPSPPVEQIVNAPSSPPSNVKPDRSSELFVNPDDDQFVANLRKNSRPWIKQISRPNNPAPYDLFMAPNGPSPYVGLVALDPTTPSLRRFSVGYASDTGFRRSGSLNLYDNEPGTQSFAHDYLLTSDGTALLHLRGREVEIIATGQDHHDSIRLTPPDRRTGANLSPQLVGLARDQSFVVRWSAVDALEEVIQRYSYATRKIISSGEIANATLAADVSALSSNLTGPVWFASIQSQAGKRPAIYLFNVTSSRGDLKTAMLPADVQDMTHYDHVELAFSPNASRIALMLCEGDRATVFEWGCEMLGGAALRVTVPALSTAAAGAHCTGTRICWIDELAFIIDGQAVCSTVPNRSGILGSLSDTPVHGATSTASDRILLSYVGDDGSCHLADVQFDPAALRNAQPVKEIPANKVPDGQ
jgi:hypothetical protein